MGRVAAFILSIGVAWGFAPHAALAQPADPLDGRVVRDIQVAGLHKLKPDDILPHLATRVGEPFQRSTLEIDRRRLDELRLFSSVVLEPRLQDDGVLLQITLAETLRYLPSVNVRITDENGVSGGLGVQAINVLGLGTRSGLSFRVGGETSVDFKVDKTTITPGTWAQHYQFTYSQRRNTLYDFDEAATTLDSRLSRNWRRRVHTGFAANILSIDTGSSDAALSPDGRDFVPTIGGFVTVDTIDSATNPQSGTWGEFEVDRLAGDAASWTVILDGRRFQRVADRHFIGLFTLASFQTGEVGVTLPEYLQFALGGANSVRGWSLGSRRGRDQFLGTLEYTYVLLPVTPFSIGGFNLYGGLQLVGFADLGKASHDATDTGSGSSIDGYGVGLRVLVPFVDAIRLELGWGEPGKGVTAYFSASLKAARQRQRVR